MKRLFRAFGYPDVVWFPKTERNFLGFICVSFILAMFITPYPQYAMWAGFLFAAYAAIANDSIQTIGTFIASNQDKKWWVLWIFIGGIFFFTMLYSWLTLGGDVSHGRLTSKGFEVAPTEFHFLQIAAPIFLLILTRLRMPVSTTFILLTSFAATPAAVGGVLAKSMSGYILSFLIGLIFFLIVAKASKKYFVGEAKFGDDRVTLKIAEVSELNPGAFIGELSFDSTLQMSVYDIASGDLWTRSGDSYSRLDAGIYALNMNDNQAFIAEASGGSYSLTTNRPIDFVKFTDTESTIAGKSALGSVTLEEQLNIVYETYWSDGGGFKIEGNNVFLKDGFYFDLDYGGNGPHLVDASSGGGYALGDGSDPFELLIKVSGDKAIAATGIDVIDVNDKYFNRSSKNLFLPIFFTENIL